MAFVLQSSAFVRKELVELIRRPRILITLVLGPFILLVIFGNSYRQQGVRLRTLFVGPPSGAYENAVHQYTDTLERYVEVLGYTSDRAAAEHELAARRADLVVIFPADAPDQIAAGKHATVLVLNDKLDPVQIAAVEIAARLAVQEANASILASVVAQAQQNIEPIDTIMKQSLNASTALNDAAARQNPDAVRAAAATLSARVAELQRATDGVASRLDSVGVKSDRGQSPLEPARKILSSIETAAATVQRTADDAPQVRQRAAEISQSLEELQPQIETFGRIDSTVLVRPFAAQTETVLPQPIGVTAFFAPSSIALLLQHLALTLAALTLIRDRSLGLVEVFRVGPTSATAVVFGRFIAFTVAGGGVAAALFIAVTRWLDVPSFGRSIWIWLIVVMLLSASVALGMAIALISRTDSEVVQYAMLILLASLFFGGFVLDLHLFNTAGRVISWLLPVTYAIKVLQTVMLRGREPDLNDIAALGAQAVIYGSLAIFMFRRRIRTT
jgi:ABC-2 type transport system permease protein